MKKKVLHLSRAVTQVLLWTMGIFFILGFLTSLGKAPAASILMLAIGLLLVPPFWRLIVKIAPNISTQKTRIAACVALFVIAVAIYPSPETQQNSEPKSAVAEQGQPSSNVAKEDMADKSEALSGISYQNERYTLSGSGAANTEYELKIEGGTNTKVRTDDNGFFNAALPEDTPLFGLVWLVRDTNGAWPGGNTLYDTKYFVLDAKSSALSDKPHEPVVLGINGDGIYEMSGYYRPGAELILKDGNEVLSLASVDDSGRYAFKKIPLKVNYTSVAIYEKISTGWFSSKEEKITNNRYLDIDGKAVLYELPTVVKEVVVTELITHSSRSVNSSSLKKGQTKVVQEGVDGKKKNTFKVTYRGNDEVRRELISSSVIKQPVEKITNVGTYVYVAPAPKVSKPTPSQTSVYYKNCTAARAAGAAPVYAGQPGYGSHLDRDRDGIGCE